MSSPIIAIVTGAVSLPPPTSHLPILLTHPQQNRGIGHAICTSLAPSFSCPLLLYATSRKGENLGFKPSSPSITINYPALDIADPRSVRSLAETIKQEHKGLDVLINNAGVNLDDRYSPENVKATLDTNYRGTLDVRLPSPPNTPAPTPANPHL